MELTVATFNIRNTTDRYSERLPLLRSAIFDLHAHLCGFQEVNFEHQLDLLCGSAAVESDVLAGPLTRRYPGPEADPSFRIDGNAVTFAKGILGAVVLDHQVLTLSDTRVAQRLLYSVPDIGCIAFVNTHLHHLIPDAEIRLQQSTQICEWLAKFSPQPAFTIVVGDFNAPPSEPAYELFKQFSFVSAYHAVHGQEPDHTFGTQLQAGTMDTDPPACVDYIWIRADQPGKTFVVQSAELGGCNSADGDSTIMPSDHFAVVAKLLLQ
eukprot:TRINITY_DN14243_c0_g1_i1.p1 TRINITY_DN14243_c0_g1~~TRINITY_DN14243_c0_g1_i1.p1  ORF type:complete len:266 (+),score=63.70 TRINITY_DN14243_c0_g1_i1:68-865(+)